MIFQVMLEQLASVVLTNDGVVGACRSITSQC
jgi:hypothetical protein